MSNDSKKPAWLLETLAWEREGGANEDYIKRWVDDFQTRYSAVHGPKQPLGDEDQAEIQRLLDATKRGPVIR